MLYRLYRMTPAYFSEQISYYFAPHILPSGYTGLCFLFRKSKLEPQSLCTRCFPALKPPPPKHSQNWHVLLIQVSEQYHCLRRWLPGHLL